MSPKSRAIFYAAVAGALGVATILGAITEQESQLIMNAFTAVLNAASTVLLLVASQNVDEDSWAAVRSSIYIATAAVMGSLTVLGIMAPGQLLPIVEVVLDTVGAIVLALAAGKVTIPEGTQLDQSVGSVATELVDGSSPGYVSSEDMDEVTFTPRESVGFIGFEPPVETYDRI